MSIHQKMRVGIIGATGMVGQNYLRLLENHPWFDVTYIGASQRSAGKTYEEAVQGRWQMESPVPMKIRSMKIKNALEIPTPGKECDLVFSAISLGKDEIRNLENNYAAAGFPVISNNSAHRTTPNVPMIIPEINHQHLELIPAQQKANNWNRGFVITKPNCGIQSYMVPIAALLESGFDVRRIITTNLQALSGAGYPGVSALDVIDNVTHLPSEEEKALIEPAKILGSLSEQEIIPRNDFSVSSHCIRVPVVHGHSSCVHFAVENSSPTLDDIAQAFRSFRPLPQQLRLPFAPDPVIELFDEPNRPQPRKDRDIGNGMAISVGRIQRCPVLGYRFFCLSHNTVRGAAGGAILAAELLVKKGFIK